MYNRNMIDKRYKRGIKKRIRTKGFTMRRLDLSRLQPVFSKLVYAYLQKNNYTQGELAEMVGIRRTHLNLLLSGKRPLSAYYVFQFIRTGIFKMSEIYDGGADNQREVEFWEMASESENVAILRRIVKLRKKGIDVEGLLDMVDPPKKKSK